MVANRLASSVASLDKLKRRIRQRGGDGGRGLAAKGPATASASTGGGSWAFLGRGRPRGEPLSQLPVLGSVDGGVAPRKDVMRGGPVPRRPEKPWNLLGRGALLPCLSGS